MKRINVEIEEELHERLKILATRKKKPIKLLVPELLKKALELEKGKNEEKDFI